MKNSLTFILLLVGFCIHYCAHNWDKMFVFPNGAVIQCSSLYTWRTNTSSYQSKRKSEKELNKNI